MTRYLIDALGFNGACRCVAGLVTLTSIFSLIFATPNPAHTHPKPQSYRALRTWIDTDAFKNKSFIWFTIAVAFLFFGFYPVFFNLEEVSSRQSLLYHILMLIVPQWAAVSGYGTRDGSTSPVHITQSSSKPLQTFWLLTIMNGASTIGRLTMAAFSDKTGPLNMHICSQIISSLLILILWTLAGSTTAAIAFCVFFGMTSGAVIGLPPASVANILGATYNTPETRHTGHAKLGQWTGMMYSFAAIPALVGPIVAGHLVTQYSTYITVQMWAGINLMISAACMLVARWYLPCYDGERVGDKLAHMLGKSDKQRLQSNATADFVGGISQAPTAVPSHAVSRQVSDEKVGTLRTPADNNV